MYINPLHDELQNQIEYEGYKNGLNPLWGKYSQEFTITPIPYGNRNKDIFKQEFQKYFNSINYYFIGEVKVCIDLYLNESKRYETPYSADIDNYAKLICDSLKGKNGILVDDSQIQTLSISWIDTVDTEYFDIKIEGLPDSFIMKEIEFFEMPNGLFYPFSDKTWTINGIISCTNNKQMLEAFYSILKNLKSTKHKLQKIGIQEKDRFHNYMMMHPDKRGYHKNRLIESGFPIYTLSEWRK